MIFALQEMMFVVQNPMFVNIQQKVEKSDKNSLPSLLFINEVRHF